MRIGSETLRTQLNTNGRRGGPWEQPWVARALKSAKIYVLFFFFSSHRHPPHPISKYPPNCCCCCIADLEEMSRFHGKKAILISSPPALAPTPAIIQSAHNTHAIWLLNNITILCTTPNLKFSDLVATFDCLVERQIEVQVANGEVVAWVDCQEACQLLQLGWIVLLSATKINGGDNELARFIIGQQQRMLNQINNKWGTKAIMSREEEAFKEELFSEGNKAWMSLVLRHLVDQLGVTIE